MDWSFLDIFKKADFNTLMFSIAVTGWILFYIYPENIYMLTAAILCSIYSVARFVVFSFKSYKRKKIIKLLDVFGLESKIVINYSNICMKIVIFF